MAVPIAVKNMAIRIMKTNATGKQRRAFKAEPGNQANHENNGSLKQRHRRASQRAAQRNLQARDRRDQRLLQESELAVPDNFDPGKNRRKKNSHGNDSRGQELDVISAAGLGERGAETEAQRQQEQQRLPERADDARGRAAIALELPQPENVDGSHRPLQTLRIMRMRSAEEASSSRMVCPVSSMNASSRFFACVRSFNSSGVPCATILP